MKNDLRGAWTWAVVGALVLAWEAVGLWTGVAPPLSRVVVEGTRRHPEAVGGLVLVVLAWLGWHLLIVPLWRRRG